MRSAYREFFVPAGLCALAACWDNCIYCAISLTRTLLDAMPHGYAASEILVRPQNIGLCTVFGPPWPLSVWGSIAV